jgi:RecJ-like exonuclease
MLVKIKEVAKLISKKSENKQILVVSHNDADGITSAAILTRALQRLDRKFSVKIIKSLDEKYIKSLPEDKIIIFLDLASNSLDDFEKIDNNDIFIIDHHEISQKIPEKINIVNPHIYNKENISSAGLVYLLALELSPLNKNLATLAVIGMIGDRHEKNIGKLNNQIIQDADVKLKRGILLYPSTRPINRVLEYSSDPFIPGVTGDLDGVIDLLNEAKIGKVGNKYKSLMELNEQEMSSLVTSILLRDINRNDRDIIGDLFLVKFFGKIEDAREISAKINACSRMGYPGTALLFCLENQSAKKRAESIHVKYRQHIVEALKWIKSDENKIEGKNYVIINAEENIKDTIIGTIASIISSSSFYNEGTVIVTMAQDSDNSERVKVSLRLVGDSGRNVKKIIERSMINIKGEWGGHHKAAGCVIMKNDRQEFINNLKSNLELEIIKI